MSTSFLPKYLKIYLWQGISFVLNFLSMFIVVPFLTSVKVEYGIYTLCISIVIFLSYADLGFVGAGQKYAAEYFAKGDRKNEIKVIGFASFVLLIFIIVFLLIFLYLSFKPELLIKNLVPGRQKTIASSLLLILAVFTPVTLLQRIAQMIFGIRLEDYVIQRVNIFASLLKIALVLFFLNEGKYNIVGYFLFTQIVSFLAAVFVLVIAKRKYKYDFALLVKTIYFNKRMYTKTKGLAFTSLYLTITWIIYYELDSIVISKFLGAEKVAIYAIGLTIMSFFRTIYAVIFAPFGARFNHFVGLNNDKGLNKLHTNVSILFAPIVIVPVLTVCFMAQPLILSWVGTEYLASVRVSQLLIMCFIYGFITYPTSSILMAKERIKELNLIGTLIPVVYWVGILLTVNELGLQAFAIFKFVAFSISAAAYLFCIRKYMRLKFDAVMEKIIRPSLLPICFLSITSIVGSIYLPIQKSKLNLLASAFLCGLIMLGSFLLYYFTSQDFKENINKVILKRKSQSFVIEDVSGTINIM